MSLIHSYHWYRLPFEDDVSRGTECTAATLGHSGIYSYNVNLFFRQSSLNIIDQHIIWKLSTSMSWVPFLLRRGPQKVKNIIVPIY